MSLMSTRWFWPPLVLFTLIDSAEAVDTTLALILGCSIGGVVFVLLIIILFILVCKRPDEKPRPGSNSINSRSGWPGAPAPVQVPPGVWTTNPSMYALRQQQHMMIRQSPKLPHQPGHHANGYANRKPQPLTDSNRLPWYLRTVRYAHNALKHFPSAMQRAPPTKRAPAPPRPKDVKPGQRPRGQRPTRDKTVREMTMKLEDDERFPQQQQQQQQNCGMRTSVDMKRERSDGTAAARIYCSEPCLDAGPTGMPHVAKIYSGYCNQPASADELRDQTNKDVARVFRSYADVSRSNTGLDERRSKNLDGDDDAPVSPIYSTPLDAITQSDWVLDQGYTSGVQRSNSHVVAGRNPYGRGVFMRPSDAAQYANKRPQKDSPRHSGPQTPVPTQILMFQHLQQQEQSKTRSSTERLSRTDDVLRPVSRSRSDASDIRHFAPENDPDAIYTRPSKIKRRSVESKGTPPRIAEESVSLPDGMSPRDTTSSKHSAPLSPIDEGANQMTVHAVIENHDDHTAEQHDLRTPSPDQAADVTRTPSPRSTSPVPARSPDRLSALLPHDGSASRRRSVDELTTMSEKHHQGEVMDAFRFLEDFDDAALSAKE